MAFYVQKFGGTSVADINCLKRVSLKIKSAIDSGHRVVVVVSAMAGETNRLLDLISKTSQTPCEREYAACLAAGEQVSAALLAMQLNQLGIAAKSINALQMKLVTNNEFKNARIEGIDTKFFDHIHKEGIVAVIAGFQGVYQGDYTTLGRGGSDTSAVALAAFLQADECQIYTDVDGVYSADPRIVEQANLLKTISYDEMLALAELGAKVLQYRSVEFARKYNVPLRVISSFNSSCGTLVLDKEKAEQPCVSGIACIDKQVKVSIPNIRPDDFANLTRYLSEANIEIDMQIQESGNKKTDMSFLMHEDSLPSLCQIAHDMHVKSGLAKISLVGQSMTAHAGFSITIMQSLLKKSVQIHNIISSPSKVSISVDADKMHLATNSLHELFCQAHDVFSLL